MLVVSLSNARQFSSALLVYTNNSFNVIKILSLQGYDSGNVSDFFLSSQKESVTECGEQHATNNGFSIKRKDSDDAAINIVQRRKKNNEDESMKEFTDNNLYDNDNVKTDWKKIFLLIVAITVHNIPGKALVLDIISQAWAQCKYFL